MESINAVTIIYKLDNSNMKFYFNNTHTGRYIAIDNFPRITLGRIKFKKSSISPISSEFIDILTK